MANLKFLLVELINFIACFSQMKMDIRININQFIELLLVPLEPQFYCPITVITVILLKFNIFTWNVQL